MVCCICYTLYYHFFFCLFSYSRTEICLETLIEIYGDTYIPPKPYKLHLRLLTRLHLVQYLMDLLRRRLNTSIRSQQRRHLCRQNRHRTNIYHRSSRSLAFHPMRKKMPKTNESIYKSPARLECLWENPQKGLKLGHILFQPVLLWLWTRKASG